MAWRNPAQPVTIVHVDDNMGRWSSGTFLAEAADWVAHAATAAGLTVTGEHDQPHLRPWSSAVRFGSDDGDLWFKVNAPGTRFEGLLVSTLSALRPDLVPAVLAVEPARGWSLTRDAGPVMRTVAPPEELWSAWEALLPRYASAQLELASHADELRATGLPDSTPVLQPAQLRGLVEELSGLPAEDGGLVEAEREALAARFGEYDAWCAALDESAIPASIQHDDLHSSNVCWGGSAAAARVIDWGDASIGFPLATMLCTLNSIAWHARCEVDDPRVERVRDAYLEPFTRHADRAELVGYVGLARRTGCVTRALSYRLSLQGEPVETHREQDFPVRGWLLELLEPVTS